MNSDTKLSVSEKCSINKSIYQSIHTLTLSVLNILAISGTSGSSGLGSHRREQMDNNTEITKERIIKK